MEQPKSSERRRLLAALGAGLGVSALGPRALFAGQHLAPPASARPVPRPGAQPEPAARPARPSLAEVIAAEGLSGEVSCILADMSSRAMIEAYNPVLALPPASVAKSITALYAMENLGPGYRFRTRVLATGPVEDGKVQGDIVLVGGGDPTLDTDRLAVMAEKLGAFGITGATGRFLLHHGALPDIDEVDPSQPPQVAYNPAISGLNLNYNRVFFEWKRAGKDYEITLDARANRFRPAVTSARMQVVDRKFPIYTYQRSDKADEWTVARSALGRGGGRWLPVRLPVLYTGEVFRSLARDKGVRLPPPEPVTGPVPDGAVLADNVSGDLRAILREMLKYSNNMTAETVGLAATAASSDALDAVNLRSSGRAMSDWLVSELDSQRPHFVDHSGLGDGSRISSHDMARALLRVGPDGSLKEILKPVEMRDSDGNKLNGFPAEVTAKTGTLNFVSALAGYITLPSGQERVFAIFSGDMARRQELTEQERDDPPGGRSWVAKARRLQMTLLRRWGEMEA